MKRTIFNVVFLFCLGFVLICGGCKKTTAEEDEAANACQRILMKCLSLAPKIRAQLALTQRKNGDLDPEPILIDAKLVVPKGRQAPVLLLTISDEDRDIMGFGVRETSVSSDMQESPKLEETYPIYVDYPPLTVSYENIPIEVRSTGQRKDENLWEAYTIDSIHNKLPPTWISLPRPGEIKVEVWLYDKAGNKSNLVELSELVKSISDEQGKND